MQDCISQNNQNETVDIHPSMHIDLNKENKKEGPKFKVNDNVRISQVFLQKVTFQIDLKKFFMILKVKNTVLWTYMLLMISKVTKYLERFTKKN